MRDGTERKTRKKQTNREDEDRRHRKPHSLTLFASPLQEYDVIGVKLKAEP